MATPASKYRQFLATLEPQVRKTFDEAVRAIVAKANISELTDAIAQASSLEAVMVAAGVTNGAYAEMAEAIREIYKQTGVFYTQAEIPRRFRRSFNMTNPRVNQWLSRASSELITGDLIPEQREAVRIALERGISAGKNPRTVALDIVGRMDARGVRRGGVIGLNRQQADYYVRSAEELATLDPHYFTRRRRDRRYDAMVRRAMDSETPLTAKQIETISGRYADRLRVLRGETIARTESGFAVKAAGDEAMQQVFDDGLTTPDAVEKVWDSTMDGRARPDHAAMNRKSVKWNEDFILPDGSRMSGPHDINGPASQVVNCRCFERRRVDFSKTVL